MRIVDRKSTLVPFKDISCGEVFKDHNGLYCMKIETCGLTNGKSHINWVRLSDGAVGFAMMDSEFEKVNCELVVSN